jgi:nucleotide-binding universal stress UspA family protein
MKTAPVLAPRIQLRNILYCTDLSVMASRALAHAALIARHFGSTVHALHVRPALQPTWSFPIGPLATKELTNEEIRQHIADRLSEFSEVRNEVMIADEGDIWLAVKTAVEENEIDLIVLGTHGTTGLSKVVLGSVAEEILRLAPCPVLTVGPRAPVVRLPYGHLSKILYATDLRPRTSAAVHYAISLTEEFQAQVTLLNVLAEPEPSDLVIPAEVQSGTEHLLRQVVPRESEHWCKPHVIVGQGTASDEILDVANQRKCDLIILGVNRPSGVATHLPIKTAHKVISRAICPVLTVRG